MNRTVPSLLTAVIWFTRRCGPGTSIVAAPLAGMHHDRDGDPHARQPHRSKRPLHFPRQQLSAVAGWSPPASSRLRPGPASAAPAPGFLEVVSPALQVKTDGPFHQSDGTPCGSGVSDNAAIQGMGNAQRWGSARRSALGCAGPELRMRNVPRAGRSSVRPPGGEFRPSVPDPAESTSEISWPRTPRVRQVRPR